MRTKTVNLFAGGVERGRVRTKWGDLSWRKVGNGTEGTIFRANRLDIKNF